VFPCRAPGFAEQYEGPYPGSRSMFRPGSLRSFRIIKPGCRSASIRLERDAHGDEQRCAAEGELADVPEPRNTRQRA